MDLPTSPSKAVVEGGHNIGEEVESQSMAPDRHGLVWHQVTHQSMSHN